ncbi:MAG: redoxin family protein [Clostridia bacterium]|nr:redoxin family protein [Clostridia bacterium]
MGNVKSFFIKTGQWFRSHAPTKRRLIQLYAALLTNANIKGVVNGRINTGNNKNLCVPGMNCYSCPGAVGACPLGSLQDSLAQSNERAPFYILGILALFGLMFARTICGFFCPVGLGQELLYKIKTPKVKKSRYTRLLSYLKYVLLVVLVIAVPLIYNGIPAFCKYVCPAGTLGGGVLLLSHPGNAGFYDSLTYLFTWKFTLLVIILVLCVFFYRFFCRFICPLGAIYGFFNRIALIGVKLDRDKCVDCGLCIANCKMDIRHVGDHECINCGECIPACPTKAISWKGSRIFLHGITPPEQQEEEVKPVEITEEVAVTAEPVQEERGYERELEEYKKKVNKRSFWLQFSAWALAIVVLITGLVYFNFIDKIENITTYGVGDTCPDFTLEQVYETAGSLDENGNVLEEFKLSNYRGKVVVLNFWYTTCDPCKAELPDFAKVQEEYGDKIVTAVIHSASSHAASTTAVQNMISRENYLNASSWQLIFTHDTDEANVYGMLGGREAFPMTVILDSNGVITFKWENALKPDTLREKINEALAAEYKG